jgi:hypothetical protein
MKTTQEGDPMEAEPRIVLARPVCSVCWDQPAAWEVLTPWDAWASLCDACREQISGPALPIAEAPAVPPLISADEAVKYLHGQEWKYARTMPKWPHWYVLARRSTDLWAHLRTVALIRAEGERRYFKPASRWHHYWKCCPEHEVWTMRPHDTILNRREVIPDDF